MVGVDNAVAAEFKGADAVTAVTIGDVPVVAGFHAGLYDTVAAGSGNTGAETGIRIIAIGVITLIHYGGIVVGVHHAVAAVLKGTGAGTAVAIGQVAVVTFLTIVHNAV